MVILFNKTMKNITSNCTLYRTAFCGDQDPPCIKNKIKHLIQEKQQKYRYDKYSLSVKNIYKTLDLIFRFFI